MIFTGENKLPEAFWVFRYIPIINATIDEKLGRLEDFLLDLV